MADEEEKPEEGGSKDGKDSGRVTLTGRELIVLIIFAPV